MLWGSPNLLFQCSLWLSVQSEVGVKNRKFNDLAHLIQQYAQRGDKNGLACPLLHPVNIDPDDDDEIGRCLNCAFAALLFLLEEKQQLI